MSVNIECVGFFADINKETTAEGICHINCCPESNGRLNYHRVHKNGKKD